MVPFFSFVFYNVNMSTFVSQLSSSLFWDVVPEEIDDEKNKRFIIQRVLERGSRNDWLLINKKYSLEVIVQESLQMRSLDPKALSYIACMGNVPKEKFRCYISKQ